MARKKIFYIDDKQKWLDAFRARHHEEYEIKTVKTFKAFKEHLEAVKGTTDAPDIILIDLFHPRHTCDTEQEEDCKGEGHAEQKEADRKGEDAVLQLEEDIKTAKRPIYEAWRPYGVGMLDFARSLYPKTPIAIYTQLGALVFDSDEEMTKISKLHGEWLFKKKNIDETYERLRLHRMLEKTNTLEDKATIKGLRAELERVRSELAQLKRTAGVSKEKLNKHIFLSHASSDKKFGDALRDFIVGLGVKNKQLIYTSHPLHKVPLDVNFCEYMRQNLHNNVFMISLWSDAYVENVACSTETSVAWILRRDYTHVFVPAFNFENNKFYKCVHDPKEKGIILGGHNCKIDMIDLKDKIVKMFNLPDDEKQTTVLLDKFMNEVKKIIQESSSIGR
jgi:hypothetical protein